MKQKEVYDRAHKSYILNEYYILVLQYIGTWYSKQIHKNDF